jgi:hypothetical protein
MLSSRTRSSRGVYGFLRFANAKRAKVRGIELTVAVDVQRDLTLARRDPQMPQELRDKLLVLPHRGYFPFPSFLAFFFNLPVFMCVETTSCIDAACFVLFAVASNTAFPFFAP